MRFQWVVEPADCEAVRTFVQRQAGKTFVKSRVQRNVDGPAPEFSHEEFWKGLVMCLLTTRQRSGPNSAVTRFLCKTPFPLALANCRTKAAKGTFLRALQSAGGIRRTETIAKQLTANVKSLEKGVWARVEEMACHLGEQRSRRARGTDIALERQAAAAVIGQLEGIGPKQSRNLWQYLGLTRYEIPVDSRIADWLKKARFPLSVDAGSLSSSHYYDFVLDGVQILCRESGVLPCVLDAAIFASYDKSDWDEGQMVY
jgi:hypothetical protein